SHRGFPPVDDCDSTEHRGSLLDGTRCGRIWRTDTTTVLLLPKPAGIAAGPPTGQHAGYRQVDLWGAYARSVARFWRVPPNSNPTFSTPKLGLPAARRRRFLAGPILLANLGEPARGERVQLCPGQRPRPEVAVGERLLLFVVDHQQSAARGDEATDGVDDLTAQRARQRLHRDDLHNQIECL